MRPTVSLDIHQVVSNAGALRDFLNEVLPANPPELADLRAHLKTAFLPEQGDIVTVIRSPDFSGAGEPQVVIGYGSGFDFTRFPGRQPDLTDYAIDAKVILGRKDSDGGIVTQDVPVWAIRPYVDPTEPAIAA